MELWRGASLRKCARVHVAGGFARRASRIDWDYSRPPMPSSGPVSTRPTATACSATLSDSKSRRPGSKPNSSSARIAPREEQSNVIASLGKAEDTAVSGVARLMQEQGLGVKKDQRAEPVWGRALLPANSNHEQESPEHRRSRCIKCGCWSAGPGIRRARSPANCANWARP